jgi:excisionase family DNA binding protein
MTKRLMSVRELSEYLSMPVATIYTYVSLGRIPSGCIKRIGRALRFEVAEIDGWINGGTAGNP